MTRWHACALAALAPLALLTACDGADPDGREGSPPTATGEDERVSSVYGRDAEQCTAPTSGDAVFGDILRTHGKATFTLKEVSLREAENLTVVEARAVPTELGGQDRPPIATDRWPMTAEGRWWWDRAETATGPHSGDVLVLVHVTRADPEKPGRASGIEFAYRSGGKTRVLDNNDVVRVANPCP